MLDGLASSRIVAISQACLFHLKPSGSSLWIFIISKDSDKQPYLDKTWLLQLCNLISLNAPCNWNKDCVLNFVRWHYHTCSTTPASCMWAYLVQAGSLHVQSMVQIICHPICVPRLHSVALLNKGRSFLQSLSAGIRCHSCWSLILTSPSPLYWQLSY